MADVDTPGDSRHGAPARLHGGGAALLIVLVLALVAVGAGAVFETVGRDVSPRSGVPILMWGRDPARSFVDVVYRVPSRRGYVLGIAPKPDGKVAYSLDVTDTKDGVLLEAALRTQDRTLQRGELYREYIEARGTVVEVTGLAAKRDEVFGKARWIEQGRGLATLYVYDRHPVEEVIAVITALRPVSQATFATQLIENPSPAVGSAPVPHYVVAGDGSLDYEAGWRLITRNVGPDNGHTIDIRNRRDSAPALARNTTWNTTVRGHPAQLEPAGADGAGPDRLWWIENGMVVTITPAGGSVEIANSLRLLDEHEWKDFVLTGLS
jgi:hypothetical protein